MKRFCSSLLWLAFVVGCARKAPADGLGVAYQPVIYGDDNRHEVYEYPDPSWRERVKASTLALIEPRFLTRPPSGRVTINAQSLQSAYALCDSERFIDQPSGADCSATLIDDDLVLTAGHCFDESDDCSTFAYVFDYFYAGPDTLATLTAADVYGCRDFVVREVSEPTAAQQIDYAVIQLDRPALAPRKPAPLSSEVLQNDEPVFVLGFPSGVPAKIDDGAHVIDARHPTDDYFKLNSDTFAGSSGSGVYTARGGLVGVLVRGAEDYMVAPDAGCSIATEVRDGQDGSPWEQATFAQRAIDALCNKSWPSERLCGIKPRCGDGFCTMDEVDGSCPVDCTSASCSRPPCTKRQEPELIAGDPVASDEDAGTTPSPIQKSKSRGCSVATRAVPFDAVVGLTFTGLSVVLGRRRFSPRRRSNRS